MKTKIYKSIIVGIMALVMLTVQIGCATESLFKSTMVSWVGASLKEFDEVYGTATKTIVSQNAEITIYRYLIAPKCTVYWYVDNSGTIKDWRYEGKGCVASFP